MFRKPVVIIGGLIALYLLVAYSKGTASLINASTSGSANVIKTLQARS